MTTPTIRCECLCTEEFCKRDCKTCHAQPVSQEVCWVPCFHVDGEHPCANLKPCALHPTEAPEDKEGWEKSFDALCIVNKFGECKYWRPEAFGYPEGHSEASMGKLFPEKIKAFITTLVDEVGRARYNEGYDAGRNQKEVR